MNGGHNVQLVPFFILLTGAEVYIVVSLLISCYIFIILINLRTYYNLRQTLITICDSSSYYKMRQCGVTICDR